MDRQDWLRRLNYLGSAIGGDDRLVALDPEEMIASARASTGLSDFGDERIETSSCVFENTPSRLDAVEPGMARVRGVFAAVRDLWPRAQARETAATH